MASPRARYWSAAQALAWIRWRNPTSEEDFACSKGDRWTGTLLYGTRFIRPHAHNDYVQQVPDPEPRLQQALQAGDLVATGRADPHSPVQEIMPVQWATLRLTPKSQAMNGHHVVFSDVRLEAEDLERLWPAREPEIVVAQADLERRALDYLNSEMRDGLARPAGVTKATLRENCPAALAHRAWNRVWTEAAKDKHPSWRAPGRPRNTAKTKIEPPNRTAGQKSGH